MKDLEALRKILIDIIAEKKGEFDFDEWVADYRLDWNDELLELLVGAEFDVLRAAKALKDKDDIDLCVAVGRARTRFLDLSNFFRDIFEDLDTLIKEGSWSEIPEDYVYDRN